jgi:hypothetical protein
MASEANVTGRQAHSAKCTAITATATLTVAAVIVVIVTVDVSYGLEQLIKQKANL